MYSRERDVLPYPMVRGGEASVLLPGVQMRAADRFYFVVVVGGTGGGDAAGTMV